MGTLSLTDPVNGQPNDATTIANNNAATKTVVNGGLDHTNLSASAGILGSQLGVAYATYAPAWTSNGTAPGPGNATHTGQYTQVGKLVHVYGVYTFGSTSTFGTGTYFFSVPVAANASTIGGAIIGSALMFDNSSGNAGIAIPAWVTATTFAVNFPATYLGTLGAAAQTSPWTWATSDYIAWNITYEAA